MGAALLASWPWDNLGFYKYVLYGPLVGKAVASRAWEAASPDRWILLLLLLFGLRALTYQLWSSFSNMLFATRRRRVVRDGVDFDQIDKEWDWDNFLILHALMAAAALCAFPSLRHLPAWDGRGFAVALVAHAAATEPLSYLAHRALHGSSGRLYARYHSLHHSSRVPQPFTAGLATPLEHVALGALMSLPLAAARAAGCASVALAFAYVLAFDSLRAMGHCNVEVVPASLFRAIPALRYVLYTPTYVPRDSPHQEGGQLLSLHAAVRSAGWHNRPTLVGHAEEDERRYTRRLVLCPWSMTGHQTTYIGLTHFSFNNLTS
uniref:aldehyde oxygenase (deformylating) n=1 Tax=Zea mays TaxID=4577 RepID=O24555_MAIZE|nr:gl1 [Zea mays]